MISRKRPEGPPQPALPAIINAIDNAVRVRIRELSVTPEKILKGLRDNPYQ
jgi:CO/xanthine dehydrogenase Mo-binding subunit